MQGSLITNAAEDALQDSVFRFILPADIFDEGGSHYKFTDFHCLPLMLLLLDSMHALKFTAA